MWGIWIQNRGIEKEYNYPSASGKQKDLTSYKKNHLFTGYISKYSPSKGGREIETYGTCSLPGIITMNTLKKKTCFYSKPPPRTLRLESVERNNSAVPNRDRVFLKSHYKKNQLDFFFTCYILYEI